ncbi:DUF4166 domain-containing protein [Pseudophaeobacter sp.]|uniref:DUF4166 domain-containing protein n=1 Tax=Pseudophaeobacter sp. TaxID=1971739 RepID=UPI003298087C
MSDAFGRIIADQTLSVPAVVARFHSLSAGQYRGMARVTGGNLLARILMRLAGFPPPGREVGFEIRIQPQDDGQIWSRRFGRNTTTSHLSYDEVQGCAVERFGPIEIDLRLRMQKEALWVDVIGARLFGRPLPRILTPVSTAREFETADGWFGFDISASLPLIGLLIRYRGRFEVPERR